MNATLPLILTTLLYLWQAGNYQFDLGRPGMAMTFVGYSLANIGLIVDAHYLR